MTPVIWYDACRGNWDHGTLLEVFEKHPNQFQQFNNLKAKEHLSGPLFKKAIVIVAGKPDPQILRDYLLTLDEGIVILTSEEDAYFNWQYAIPDHLDLWTQYYSPSTKSEIKTRLLLGAPLRIRDYKINKHLEKKYLWSFVGQVQNPFRQACVDVLKTLPNGFLHIAEAFGGEKNGIEYQNYLDIMCQSKYVICPAGSMCVDSFRLYEAMECGAIPITDKRAPRDSDVFNYWDEVINSATDLPIVVSNWEQIKTLEYLIIKQNQNNWWFQYKKQLENKLLKYAHG